MTPGAGPVIRCRELTVGHDEPVLSELTFSVAPGETLALVGERDCGKSTLLKTLAGIRDPVEGEATVLGTSLPGDPPAGELGYIPQDLGLVDHASVRRNVLLGTLADVGFLRTLLGWFPADARTATETAIEAVGLAGKADERVQDLSDGRERRAAMARACVQEPRLLLADELLSDLDEETATDIVAVLKSLQERTGMSVVIAEHDREGAEEFVDRIVSLDRESMGHGATSPSE